MKEGSRTVLSMASVESNSATKTHIKVSIQRVGSRDKVPINGLTALSTKVNFSMECVMDMVVGNLTGKVAPIHTRGITSKIKSLGRGGTLGRMERSMMVDS